MNPEWSSVFQQLILALPPQGHHREHESQTHNSGKPGISVNSLCPEHTAVSTINQPPSESTVYKPLWKVQRGSTKNVPLNYDFVLNLSIFYTHVR